MQDQSSYDLLKSRPEITLGTFDIPQTLQYGNDQTQEFTTNRTPLARAHSANAQHLWNCIQRPQSSQGALYIPDIPSASVTSPSAYIQQAGIDTSETRQGYWDVSFNDATGSEYPHPVPALGVADNVPRVQLPLIFDFGSSSYMPAASYSGAHGQIDQQQQQLDNRHGQEHQTQPSWDQVSTTLQQQQYGTFNLEDGETANGNVLDLKICQENGSCIAEFDKVGQSINPTARHFSNQQQPYHQRDRTPINFAAHNAGGNAEWQQQVLYPMRSPVFAEDSISSIGPIQSFHNEMEITADSPSSEKGEHGHGYGQGYAHSDSFSSGNVEQVETAHATSRPSLDSEGAISANSWSSQSHSSEYGHARGGCGMSVESQTSASTGISLNINAVNALHGGQKCSLGEFENNPSNVSHTVDQPDASQAKRDDSHGVPEVTKQNRRGRRPGNKEMTLEKRIKNRESSQRFRQKVKERANENNKRVNFLELRVRQLEYELFQSRQAAQAKGLDMTAMTAGLSSNLATGCGNDKIFSGSLSAVVQKPVEWNGSIASDERISPPDGDVSQAAITLLKEENQMLRRNLKLAEDKLTSMRNSSPSRRRTERMKEGIKSSAQLPSMDAQLHLFNSLDVPECMGQQSLSSTSFTSAAPTGPTQAAMEQLRAGSKSVACELTTVKPSSLQASKGSSDFTSNEHQLHPQGRKPPETRRHNIARLPANALSIQYADAPFTNLSLGLAVEYPLSAPTTAHLPRLATPVQRPFTAGTGSRPGSVFDTLPVQSAPDNARVGGAGEKRNTTELRPQQYMQSMMVQPTPLLAKRRKSPQGTCSSAIPRSSSSKVSTTDDASISAVSGGPFSTAMEVCGEECEPNPGILGERFPHQHA